MLVPTTSNDVGTECVDIDTGGVEFVTVKIDPRGINYQN